MTLTSTRLFAVAAVITLFTDNIAAQVHIPDLVLRDSLNAQVPGLVDGVGNMDELDPGIAQITELVLSINSTGSVVDLSGLEYLHALEKLTVTLSDEDLLTDTISLPGFPDALDELSISAWNDETILLGQLPQTMSSIQIVSHHIVDATCSVVFSGLPDHVEEVGIHATFQMEWPGMLNCGAFDLGYSESQSVFSIVVPQVQTEQARFSLVFVDSLDISQVNAPVIEMTNVQVQDWIQWPAGVDSLSLVPDIYEVVLPSFPADLVALAEGADMPCIPSLPNTLNSLYVADETACMPNWPSALPFATFGPGVVHDQSTALYCSVLNSECPGSGASLSGRVVMDLNTNGLADIGEPAVPDATIHLSPTGHLTGCDAAGQWEIGVSPGSHVITATTPYPYVQSTVPSEHEAEVVELGEVHPNNDFAVSVFTGIQDLRISLHANQARPGFGERLYLHCVNYGTTILDAELTLTFDADQTWVGSSVTPTSLTGNTVTWELPAMPIGAVHDITIDLNTASTVALGTEIIHTLVADPIATDETPADNTAQFADLVVGSYDPNDKFLSPAVLSPAQVAQGETPIEYTIRFQNTGTFLAERVVILDTLSEDLQWESIRFIASSHANHWYITDGVLHVIHNDIMLPDSTSDEPGSHGFIQFSMLPKSDLQDGATITNIAHIVFDFNEPIITPPAVFSVDIETGLVDRSNEAGLRLSPNPAADRIQIRVDGTASLRYRIIDVLGAQVQLGTIMPNGWVNIDPLPAGPYLLEVEHDGVRTSQRFVKQ